MRIAATSGHLYVTGSDITVQLQWGPTLTSHDPSPPITLEDAAAVAPTDPPPAAFGWGWRRLWTSGRRITVEPRRR